MAAPVVPPGAMRIPVHRRFSDLDPLGHVNNVVYFDYLQEARVAMLRDTTLIASPSQSQVIARQELAHRKPLYLAPEPLIIATWVSHIGRSSYTVDYVVYDEHGDVAAEASTLVAVIDTQTERPTRMSDALRAVLEPLAAAVATAAD